MREPPGQSEGERRCFGGTSSRQPEAPPHAGLLDEFRDESGRTLRENLDALGESAPEFAARILFYDAPAGACPPAVLAQTSPGSRVVWVCGARFVRQMTCDSRHAEAVLIHELLHALDLGEDPPRGDRVTARARECCGHAGSTPKTELAHR
jgi:hypothetical protein